jgi:hypothetical protein
MDCQTRRKDNLSGWRRAEPEATVFSQGKLWQRGADFRLLNSSKHVDQMVCRGYDGNELLVRIYPARDWTVRRDYKSYIT